MNGNLILVPTPIDESLPLETVAKDLLGKECLKDEVILLVEEHKVARQRWILWGLPREAIDRFIVFNEHTQDKIQDQIIDSIKSGKTAYLISDGGLPAFCDPGQRLVKKCHEKSIKVSSTPFPNSISLAVSLSGIEHERFLFAGFLPTEPTTRKKEIEALSSRNETVVLMDTPYRLQALLTDISTSRLKGRRFFLACNLNSKNEACFYGSFSDIQTAAASVHKPEFILVISGT